MSGGHIPTHSDHCFYVYVSNAEKHTVSSRRASPEGLHIKRESKADKAKGGFIETTVPASSSRMLVKIVTAYIESICPIFFSGNICMHLYDCHKEKMARK